MGLWKENRLTLSDAEVLLLCISTLLKGKVPGIGGGTHIETGDWPATTPQPFKTWAQ